MIDWKTTLTSFTRFFVYSLIILVIDASIIFLLSWGVDRFAYTLSFFMLIEGGIGLIFGSVIVSYSPLTAKVSEALFRSKPWNFKRQKEIEQQMGAVFATDFILILEALLVSAL